MIEYCHEDGTVCCRPGPRGTPVGSFVESEFEIVYGVCEHTVLAIHELAPEPEPEVTVQKIVQAAIDSRGLPVNPLNPSIHIDRARPGVHRVRVQSLDRATGNGAETFDDAPVSAEVIERAKVPPKIKVDLATSPLIAQTAARMPVEKRYEFNLDPEELAELNSIRGIDEPIGGGAPVNPFDSNFDARPSAQAKPQAPRRPGKPVSVFDR